MPVDVNVLTNGWTIAGIIATFLVAAIALGLGLASIIQTKRLQKRERRERLLNEIIEWAERILSCGVVLDIADLIAVKSMNKNSFNYFILEKQSREFSQLLTKGIYMSEITLEIERSKIIYFLVGKTRENLNNHIKLLELNQQGKVKKQDSIARHRELINDFVKRLIEEATKIKTKDII